MKVRLISYLEKNSLLLKNQFGFRPSLRTQSALYYATRNVYITMHLIMVKKKEIS